MKKKIVQHILFWIGIFLFYIVSSTDPELFEQTVITTLVKFPLLILAAYAFNYWQVPSYLKQKKYIGFAVSMLGVIIVLVILFRFIGYFYLDRFCADGPYPLLSLVDFPFYMLSFHFPALLMYFYKVNKEQEIKKEKIFQLQKEKITTELKYLKAQLNPHFLFNTLNNLYSYVLIKSPKAPDMVLQLSEILDYILYKSQHDFVALREEIQIIENYLALEQIKYGNRIAISFEKEIQHKELKITPLLLLSIVENAFKHGASGSIEKPTINISLKELDSTIEFVVWNTVSATKKDNKTDSYKSGIGLSNIQRQLDLIYPEKHELITEETDSFFNLRLTLKID